MTAAHRTKKTRRKPREHAPRPALPADHLLTGKEVAQIFRVSVMTVRRLIERGDLAHVRIGGQIRFTRAQVQRYVDNLNFEEIDPNVALRLRQQNAAHQAVSKAIRIGRLTHPAKLRCTDCRAEWHRDGPRHEYDHHVSYSVEHHLSVEPVCQPCHQARERHRRETNTVIP